MPPVALKDRIALLQQQSSTTTSSDHQPVDIGTVKATVNLKDKIANFERKGAVPVPRGSFGLGAPPVDDGSSRRKGELYGNRVPGLSKPTVDSVLPNTRKRTVSTSHVSSFSISSRSATPPVPELPDGLATGGSRPSTPSLGARRLPSGVAPSMRRAVSEAFPSSLTFEDQSDEHSKPVINGAVMEEADEGMEKGHSEADGADKRVEGETAEVGPQRSASGETGHIASPARPSIVVSPIVSPQPTAPSSNVTSPTQSSPSEYSPVSSRKFESARTSPSAQSPTMPVGVSPILSAPFTEDRYSRKSSPITPQSTTSLLAKNSPSESEFSSGVQADQDGNTLSEEPSLLLDDKSASSDTVPTPRDDVFDNLSPDQRRFQARSHSPGTPQVTVVTVLEPLNSGDARRRLSVASNLSAGDDSLLADKSLALDTSEAVIVTDAPHIASPTLATLVPAPRPSPSPSPAAAAPPPSPWVSDLEEQMSAPPPRQSFHATVHHKVRETLPAVSQPEMSSTPAPACAPASVPSVTTTPSERKVTPRPRTIPAPLDRIPSIVRSSVIEDEEPPNSAGMGDLTMLLHSAALLEEQLSTPSPSKLKTSQPESPKDEVAQPKAVPEVRTTVVPPPILPPPIMAPSASVRASSDVSEPSTPRQSDTPGRPTSINIDPVEEDEIQDSFSMSDISLGRAMLMFPTPRTSSLPYLNPTPPHSPANLRSADPRLETGQTFPTHSSPGSSRSRLQSNASQTSARSRLQSNASQASSLRSRLQSNASEDVPPTPPPKSPSRYFSSFRMRKPSMPGAFPRTSYSSEDSSVMLPTPPSPTHQYPGLDSQSERSDTSSIRSSGKSLKSPKRSKTTKSSLGRASSVVEKLWRGGKKSTDNDLAEEDDSHLSAAGSSERASSPTHLSPYNVPPVPHLPAMQQRPTSWVSIETTGSGGDVFARDLFDSFPVPGSAPLSNAHRQYRSTSSHLGPNDYGHSSEMGYSVPMNMPNTLPNARSNAHSKQRSALI